MFESNVIIACQFEDTGWNYMENHVFNGRYDTFEDALCAMDLYMMSDKFKEDVDRHVRLYSDVCIAFEAEQSITEDGYEFMYSSEGEYFYNDNVWARDNYEDYL